MLLPDHAFVVVLCVQTILRRVVPERGNIRIPEREYVRADCLAILEPRLVFADPTACALLGWLRKIWSDNFEECSFVSRRMSSGLERFVFVFVYLFVVNSTTDQSAATSHALEEV